MHEIPTALGLLRDLRTHARRHGVVSISRIHVRMGSLCSTTPEELTFAFQMLSEGTLAEGAELRIDVVPGKARCEQCSIEFPVDAGDITAFPCPRCGGMVDQLLSGRECDIALIRARGQG